MIVAIHQPNYAPWCGYFAKMRACNAFVLLDDVQFSKGSYTSRCKIRNGNRAQWFSVPVQHSYGQLISGVRFGDTRWAPKHLKTLRQVYGKAPFFDEVFTLLEPMYREPGDLLSHFNTRIVRLVKDYLQLPCQIYLASQLNACGHSDDHLINLIRVLGGHIYLSGAGGQKYQDLDKFANAGMTLHVMTYTPIPYPQGHASFVGGLSILDALFNLGRGTLRILEYSARGSE